MSTTTIKVDATIRDRLAVLARRRGTSMGALLAEMTERMERDEFFATANAQLAKLRRDDPDDWASYREESRTWQEGTDVDSLATKDEAGWWE
jgi:antitoxin MazE7